MGPSPSRGQQITMSPPGCQKRQHTEFSRQFIPQPYGERRAIRAATTVAAEVARPAAPRYAEPLDFSDVSATNPGKLFMRLPLTLGDHRSVTATRGRSDAAPGFEFSFASS